MQMCDLATKESSLIKISLTKKCLINSGEPKVVGEEENA